MNTVPRQYNAVFQWTCLTRKHGKESKETNIKKKKGVFDVPNHVTEFRTFPRLRLSQSLEVGTIQAFATHNVHIQFADPAPLLTRSEKAPGKRDS